MLMFVLCALTVTILYVLRAVSQTRKTLSWIAEGRFLGIGFGIELICVVFHIVHFKS